MGAKNPVRRKMTAREAAEKFGTSTRTIQRLFAEPRHNFLDRAQQRREQAVGLRERGLTYRQIAEQMGCTVGTVGRLLHDARKYSAGASDGSERAAS
jgi:transposase